MYCILNNRKPKSWSFLQATIPPLKIKYQSGERKIERKRERERKVWANERERRFKKKRTV